MHTDTHPKMSNVNMSDDPYKEHELHAITSEDEETGMPESDVETVLGSVHISKPSIKHVFFLLRPILKPILEQFNKQEHELHELVNMMKLERTAIDTPAMISANISYEVDYKGRQFLYVFTPQTLTLNLSSGGAIIATTNNWTPLALPRGTKITAGAIPDAQPFQITIRATDRLMAVWAELVNGVSSIGSLGAGTAFIGYVGNTSEYPTSAIPIDSTSGNVANAVATATLAANATRTTYITGFEVTGAGATTGLPVQVTVTNTVGGTLTYIYSAVAGVLLENTPLIVQFPKAIAGFSTNLAIAVSCPALGAGNTNNSVNAHGYQL